MFLKYVAEMKTKWLAKALNSILKAIQLVWGMMHLSETSLLYNTQYERKILAAFSGNTGLICLKLWVQGDDYASKFPRYESDRAPVGCVRLPNPIHRGPISKLSGLKGSAAHVMVPDTTAPCQRLSGVCASIGRAVLAAQVTPTHYMTGGHDVTADWCFLKEVQCRELIVTLKECSSRVSQAALHTFSPNVQQI